MSHCVHAGALFHATPNPSTRSTVREAVRAGAVFHLFETKEKRQWWAAVGELLAAFLSALTSTATDDDFVKHFNYYLEIHGGTPQPKQTI